MATFFAICGVLGGVAALVVFGRFIFLRLIRRRETILQTQDGVRRIQRTNRRLLGLKEE